ncbi:type II toxin-antitoxin system YoeB family toxin [Lacticaseibacillus yichunensis]|uniref:Endoribonuclease YoeB n=1 Tax=Lacticaseibacillus yichunensis TaxID=2486015 RepID=A0ABW4CNH5_9LACO|nr:type II toxin-antitoxin system YoeB family toxin [Lacticaseibacillus yichunensis]
MKEAWKVVPYRDVKRKEEDLLKRAGLFERYLEVINTLKENPFSSDHQRELLTPHAKQIYSMRINAQHRVVYTVDKKTSCRQGVGGLVTL